MKRPGLVHLFVALALVVAAIVSLGPRARAEGAKPPGWTVPEGLFASQQVLARTPRPVTFSEDSAAIAGLLEGRVVTRDTERGVAGARLVFRHAATMSTVLAGADGAFSFSPPAAGRWDLVSVNAEGYYSYAPVWGASPLSYEARPGERVKGLFLQLAPASLLRVHVVDETGAPLAGARVTVRPDTGNRISAEPALVAEAAPVPTDASGDATVRVAPGAFLTLDCWGYSSIGMGLFATDLAKGLPAQILRGSPSHVVAGRVVDSRGAPVPGALVEAVHGADREGVAITDARGAFALSVSTNRFDVRARATPQRVVSVGGAPGAREVELRMPDAAGELGLNVRDADTQAPITAFAVALEGPRGVWGVLPPTGRAVLDSAGTWVWSELPAGNYLAFVSAYGYAPAVLTSTLADGARATLDVALWPGGRVAGKVTVEGSSTPLPGARIAVESPMPSDASVAPVASVATSDAEGAFEVVGVAPGARSVAVRAPGYRERTISGVEVRGRRRTQVAIALAAVEPGEVEIKLRRAGIGATLVFHGLELTIVRVAPRGGAALAGLGPGDRIRAIDGLAVAQLGYGEAIDALSATPGTHALLQVARAGNETIAEVSVERRPIER